MTIYISQQFRGHFADNRFLLLGAFWAPHGYLESQIKSRGGQVLGGSSASLTEVQFAELQHGYLVLGPNVITPKDSIGLEFDLRAEVSEVVRSQIHLWCEEYGMRVLAERDLREALDGKDGTTAISRHRATLIDRQVRGAMAQFTDVLAVLDDVIDEKDG